jgi:hypothetical protein
MAPTRPSIMSDGDTQSAPASAWLTACLHNATAHHSSTRAAEALLSACVNTTSHIRLTGALSFPALQVLHKWWQRHLGGGVLNARGHNACPERLSACCYTFCNHHLGSPAIVLACRGTPPPHCEWTNESAPRNTNSKRVCSIPPAPPPGPATIRCPLKHQQQGVYSTPSPPQKNPHPTPWARNPHLAEASSAHLQRYSTVSSLRMTPSSRTMPSWPSEL